MTIFHEQLLSVHSLGTTLFTISCDHLAGNLVHVLYMYMLQLKCFLKSNTKFIYMYLYMYMHSPAKAIQTIK